MAKDTYDVRIWVGSVRGIGAWQAIASVARNYELYLYAALDVPSYVEAVRGADRLNAVAEEIQKQSRRIRCPNV